MATDWLSGIIRRPLGATCTTGHIHGISLRCLHASPAGTSTSLLLGASCACPASRLTTWWLPLEPEGCLSPCVSAPLPGEAREVVTSTFSARLVMGASSPASPAPDGSKTVGVPGADFPFSVAGMGTAVMPDLCCGTLSTVEPPCRDHGTPATFSSNCVSHWRSTAHLETSRVVL